MNTVPKTFQSDIEKEMPALIKKIPQRGESLDLFPMLTRSILESGIGSIEVRRSKTGMRLAARRAKDNKLDFLTECFPCIFPVYTAGLHRYFYAGNEDDLRLHVIVIDRDGIGTKEVQGISFSLKDISQGGEHIGSGVLEYMIPEKKTHESDSLAWRTVFVNLKTQQGYDLGVSSFERKDEESVFEKDGRIYIVGRSFQSHVSEDRSKNDNACVLVLPKPGEWDSPVVLGGKWFGQITPMFDTRHNFVGFRGLSFGRGDADFIQGQITLREYGESLWVIKGEAVKKSMESCSEL